MVNNSINYSKKQQNNRSKVKPATVERLKNYCVYLLSRCDYTEKKLVDNIKKRYKDSAPFIDEVVAYLYQLDYLNDQRYLDRCIELMMEEQLTQPQMKVKLFTKQFTQEMIETALSQCDFSTEQLLKSALRLKRKWYGDEPVTELKIKQRGFRRLAAHGYPFHIINQVMSNSSH